MNIITAQRTYKTVENATKALQVALDRLGMTTNDVRYLIAVSANGTPEPRFVPTVVSPKPEIMLPLAHLGIMVVS